MRTKITVATWLLIALAAAGCGKQEPQQDAFADEYLKAAEQAYSADPGGIDGAIWGPDWRSGLAAGEPVTVTFHGRRQAPQRNRPMYLFVWRWRNLLSPAARDEYARRCRARAREELSPAVGVDPFKMPSGPAVFLLETAYNIADTADLRDEIGAEYLDLLLRARDALNARFEREYGTVPATGESPTMLDWQTELGE